MYTSEEVMESFAAAGLKKTKTGFLKLFVAGILAGAFVAFGGAAGSVAMHNVSNVGLGRMAAGVVFPVGLMFIILIGCELFTGDCLMLTSVIKKRISVLNMLKVLGIVYISNFVGGVLIALMVSYSGQFDYSAGLLGAFTIKTALGKVQIPFMKALVSGILCNIIVCLTVLIVAKSKEVSGKVLATFFPIMLFVVTGFEHCVANMFYVPAGIFALNNPHYASLAAETYNLGAEALSQLTWQSFFINNLIPVTLGNIIGGFAVAAAFCYINSKDKKEG